jgi:dimethylhistidine N-methyltransferase
MTESITPAAQPVDARAEFLAHVHEGLALPQKQLSCKYLYDKRGSELFDQICELEEYYPTRTEMAIMEERVDEMADRIGPRCMLIELGSGSSLKTRILLDHLDDLAGYVPIDISGEYLQGVAERLQKEFPQLPVYPVAADYTRDIELPEEVRAASNRVAYFPGSTIGNFVRAEARAFLERLRPLMGSGGGLLIGVDLKKDPAVLERAYDDAAGVTAAFNLNILDRINRELDGAFDLNAFRHRAIYNPEAGRVEMHIESLGDQEVDVGGETFAFEAGETIWTECSHKYTLEEFADLASEAGLEVRQVWTDADNLFSVQFLCNTD